MRVTVSVKPTAEPVSLGDAKEWLRVEHTADDTVILGLIYAARDLVEKAARRSIITRTLIAYLTPVEAAPPFSLPYGPVASVSEFATWSDASDAYVAAASTAYQLAGDRIAVSQEADATAWPTYDRYEDAVRITYVAGKAYLEQDEPIRQAILSLVGTWYENREMMGTMTESAKRLLDPYINYAHA